MRAHACVCFVVCEKKTALFTPCVFTVTWHNRVMSEPPMLQAAYDGDAAALRRLIDAGGNVDERNEVRAPPSRSPSPRVPCCSEERARRLSPHAHG